MSWHPARREILVRRRLNATSQVHHVSVPLTTPQPVTDFPNAVNGATYQPTHGEYFVFPMGEGGNEVFRLYRYDVATKEVTPISPDGERVGSSAFNRKGDRLAYSTVMIDRNNPDRNSRTTLHLVDPRKPQSGKVIAKWDGGTWTSFRFSEDGRRLVYMQFVSVNESHLWVMDIASGKKRRVTSPACPDPAAKSSPTRSKLSSGASTQAMSPSCSSAGGGARNCLARATATRRASLGMASWSGFAPAAADCGSTSNCSSS